MGSLLKQFTTNEIKANRKKHEQEILQLESYFRLANYLTAAQIYLKDNFLLEHPLHPEHIKDRLLGHWGTSPGINLIYSHLNRMILSYDLNLFLVTGPGHGAPANLSNLYLEGSLAAYYDELQLDRNGMEALIHRFSWPGGFPSHLYPGTPGTIHEGGELGYALATAFGAIMDNKDLIVACIVGDGESETGPTATAWHSTKFIDPAESGAVLPILHLNGYKISNPTIYASMDDEELGHLFTGMGYLPILVDGEDWHSSLWLALELAHAEIKKIQKAARKGTPLLKPHFPMIILRSPKGWTGIKEVDGVPIEGTFRAHQVPCKDCKTNPSALAHVEKWLRSYEIDALLTKEKNPKPEVLKCCPKGEKRMGVNPHTFGGKKRVPLKLPPLSKYEVYLPKEIARGSNFTSHVRALGEYMKEVIASNPDNFRIFSPDELASNQLDGVFEVTHRNYQWPIASTDEHIAPHGGRVSEILSEHTCQGWLQGYLMTGRHGLFPSYEAFLGIVETMMLQFAKFLKFARETNWREPFASLNYIQTSTLWRQDHNGFSHQNPGFLNALLNLKPNICRIYLPPDANCLISTMDHCLASVGYVNLVVVDKQPMPQWLSMEEAIAHCRAGASVWRWASTDEGVDPDVVLVGIGDHLHLEVMAAAHILRQELPELRVRVVNITDLLILSKETTHPHGLDEEMFDALFTRERPVIMNFHGYPSACKQLLYLRPHPHRFTINGYHEEGTTTTPFDMNVRNKTSRFHLIMQAIRAASKHNPAVAAHATQLVSHYEYELQRHRDYILKHGKDPDEISAWKWG